MRKAPKPRKVDVRLVIVPAGSVRSDADLRKDVTDALDEATEEFRKQCGISDVRTEGAPQGGFLGAGAEWPWIVSVLSPIAWELVKEITKAGAEEAGKEGAKSLFSYIKEALRKRNLSAASPKTLTRSGHRRRPNSANGRRKSSAATKPGHSTKKGRKAGRQR